jgi:hypothetical protein
MAAMGGGQMPQQQEAMPQFAPQQFDAGQIMQRAKGADAGMRDAYQAELVNQLRGGTFKDGQGVWANALNTYDQGQQAQSWQAEQQRKAQEMMQAEQQPEYNWAAGDGG